MPLIGTFYNVLQKEITTVVSVRQHLQRFRRGIVDIREKLTHMPFEDSETSNAPKKRQRNTNKTACGIECCNIIIKEAEERFCATEHLECFSLVDPAKFSDFKSQFPHDLCSCSKYYPFIQVEKLKSELHVLCSSEEFKDISSISALYSFF
jgi:hypothetical protein